MAIGYAEKQAVKKSEAKLIELHAQTETAAKELARAIEAKDLAISTSNALEVQSEKIKLVIFEKNKEIEVLDAIISRKRGEIGVANASRTREMASLKREIVDMGREVRKLEKRASNARITAKKLSPLVEKYKNTLVVLSQTERLVKIAISAEAFSKREAEKSQKKADAIMDKAIAEKTEASEKFKALQKYETGLNFYAQRLRNWYQEKGLKLPVEYMQENITKK